MKKRIALDLFSGAGGAALGLLDAGFDEVVGIDIREPTGYPGTFIHANVAYLPVKMERFDFVWASPPCQRFSKGSLYRAEADKKHKNWIPFTKWLLKDHPYTCIENVMMAYTKGYMRADVTLTGPSNGLNHIQRTRVFETSFFMLQPPRINIPREQWKKGEAVTITGSLGSASHFYPRKAKGLKGKLTNKEGRDFMGIGNQLVMTDKELGESVPPPYSERIGRAALDIMKNVEKY